MVDSNFWFYTLSAIPQTLAAMIALVATFVVFRLNYLNELIRRDYELARWFLLKMDADRYSKTLKDMTDEKVASAFKDESDRLQGGKERLGLNEHQFSGIQDELPKVIETYYGFLGYFTSSPDRMAEFIKQRAHNFQENITNKGLLYGYLKKDIKIIAFPVIFSLIFLPLYSVIVPISIEASIVAVAVVSAVYSIVYTAYSVWRISHL